MSMLDLLRQRRSVRSYRDQALENDKLKLLCEALLRAPSSRNLQPCQFVLVDEADTLKHLATAKPHGTSFFQTAPLAVVIAADPAVSDVWIEDCSVAAFTLQLAAEELGLKSCWGQLRLRAHDEERSASQYVRDLVGLPEQMEVPIVIAVGYPDQKLAGHPRSSLANGKIHWNNFSS
jgi:nitroreductase